MTARRDRVRQWCPPIKNTVPVSACHYGLLSALKIRESLRLSEIHGYAKKERGVLEWNESQEDFTSTDMKNYHLSPNGSRWTLSEEGGAELATFGTKADAVHSASRTVEKQTGSLKIHRATAQWKRNGPIRAPRILLSRQANRLPPEPASHAG